jgi:hypothetical protein
VVFPAKRPSPTPKISHHWPEGLSKVFELFKNCSGWSWTVPKKAMFMNNANMKININKMFSKVKFYSYAMTQFSKVNRHALLVLKISCFKML